MLIKFKFYKLMTLFDLIAMNDFMAICCSLSLSRSRLFYSNFIVCDAVDFDCMVRSCVVC